ncbi:MAG: hypothetical protein QM679_04635 [Patulibacter sp.]
MSATEPLAPTDLALRERFLKWVAIVAIVDLVLFLPLLYGVITGNKELTPLFGPLHGTFFLIEVGLVAWGASSRWWGWWYPVVTIITTGPPGALLGHSRAKHEARGA